MKTLLRIAIVPIILLAVQMLPAGANAQSGSDWTAPLMLYRSDLSVSWPIVVADAYGTVHVFWVEGSSEQTPSMLPSVIFHMQNENGRWSKPSDILLSPGNQSATTPEVAADIFGRLHMIWYGPNNTLYYSNVDGRKAGDAGAWSAPRAIATSLIHAGIFADAKGNIHVAYPNPSGFGVSYTSSADGGASWSSPATVAAPSRDSAAADYAQLAVDSAGNVHVVWTEFQLPNGWPPLGVFYARSVDGGKAWSGSLRLAGEGYDVATVKVGGDDTVHIDWNGMITVGGRYYVLSRDQGKTWSKPVAVVPAKIGGTSGYADLAVDSNNGLHMASSVAQYGGIVYSELENWAWSPRVGISGGIKEGDVASVEQPRIAVTGGNQLHVVFEVEFKTIYYVSRLIDAPSATPVLLPAPAASAMQTPAKVPASPTLLKPRPTILLDSAADITTQAAPPDSSLPLLVGVVPVLALLALVAVVRLSR